MKKIEIETPEKIKIARAAALRLDVAASAHRFACAELEEARRDLHVAEAAVRTARERGAL